MSGYGQMRHVLIRVDEDGEVFVNPYAVAAVCRDTENEDNTLIFMKEHDTAIVVPDTSPSDVNKRINRGVNRINDGDDR